MSRPGRDNARTGSTTVRASNKVDEQHLNEFVTGRRGVEGFVEPRTAVSDVTLLLVAHDGEWTRRRVDSEKAAAELGRRLGIPVYDVHATGYPQRMREWTRRRKEAGDTGVPGLEGPSV